MRIQLEDAGPELPAQRMSTSCEWEDVALAPSVRWEIEALAERAKSLRAEDGSAKSGVRVLFSGESGTGKTLAAALLGKATGLPVYRVDLAAVVSKWSGETEKSLDRLFDRAEPEGWILYFDEADALFGKRTESRNANDRAANQQIAYLLQRIEDFSGLVILATNLKSNLDEAFTRRLQVILNFPPPGVEP